MTKLTNKYMVLTDLNREPFIKYCEDNGIVSCGLSTVREMIESHSSIKVIGFDEAGYADHSSVGIDAYVVSGCTEITIEDLQPSIKKKFIFITSANREFLAKYCESMGLKTRSGRTARTLLDKGVEVISFKEDGYLDYSQMGLIQHFLDGGYDEITSCDLFIPQDEEVVVVAEEPEVVVLDKVPTKTPCKREMIIKLNEMYNTRDSLDLVIEQTEQLLKNVL